MEPTGRFYDFNPRLDHEVIGVAKHELHAELIDEHTIKRLERAIRADRHKVGRIDDAMGRVNPAHPCPRLGGLINQFERETSFFLHSILSVKVVWRRVKQKSPLLQRAFYDFTVLVLAQSKVLLMLVALPMAVSL
jgi:hypothetical protein